MNILSLLFTTVFISACYIWPSRIISMTFKTFCKSITIRNENLAELLIAEKNTWGIATDPKKRNQMSLWGAFSYFLFLPQIVSFIYHWWIFFNTGSDQLCQKELGYLWLVWLFYAFALIRNIKEGNKFNKGEIW